MAAVVDADEVVIIGGAVAPVIGDDFVVPAGKLYCGLCGPNGVFDTPSQIANHKRGHWHAGKVAGRPQTSEVKKRVRKRPDNKRKERLFDHDTSLLEKIATLKDVERQLQEAATACEMAQREFEEYVEFNQELADGLDDARADAAREENAIAVHRELLDTHTALFGTAQADIAHLEQRIGERELERIRLWSNRDARHDAREALAARVARIKKKLGKRATDTEAIERGLKRLRTLDSLVVSSGLSTPQGAVADTGDVYGIRDALDDTCALCLEELAPARRPVRGPCGHCLCHGCMEQQFKEGRMECIVCRQPLSAATVTFYVPAVKFTL